MKPGKIVLKKGKESFFRGRHPWIFSGAIASYPDSFEDGAIFPIHSHNGDLLGHGYFRKSNSLAGRILSFGKEDPWTAVYRHLDQAIQMRDSLLNQNATNAYRLVNGEGDHIPGLIVDQYGEYLVLQSSTLGIDLMKERVVEHLAKKGRWRGIFEKSTSTSREQEGLSQKIGCLWGEEVEEITIRENHLHFLINWKKGQKTGFFLDQREMRSLIGSLSKGRRVLNCFSYTGGFSVYALKNGATRVDSLDCSATALDEAKKNFSLNSLPLDEHLFIEKDAFDFLRKDPLEYDLVILDPPAFIKRKNDLSQGVKGYREINAQVLSKMPKGSILLTCSCSYYMDEALFRTTLFQAGQNAGRDLQIIKETFHALDHPISLFHPEGRYLKSLLIYISN
jgi:23S rRNA (cytosine1962-C5)-methyltransferase